MARVRNRIVKADYYADPELLRWHRDKRETYRGLWAIAEDSGCLEDDPFGWKVLIWPSPLDADITVELLAKWRDELIEAGKLVPYEAEGKRYLWIRNFHQHEKPPNPQSNDLPLPPWVRRVDSEHDRRNGRVKRCRYDVEIDALSRGCDSAMTELSQHDDSTTTVLSPLYCTELYCTELDINTFGAPNSGAPPVETVDNSSTTDFEDIDFEEDEPCEDRHTLAQRLVAYYVDEHARLGRSEPTRRQVGICAQVIGEKLEGGANPEHVREAIRRLVERGKAPSILAALVAEVEAERLQASRHPAHVPFKPPPDLTPEEREASLRAMREARERAARLSRSPTP